MPSTAPSDSRSSRKGRPGSDAGAILPAIAESSLVFPGDARAVYEGEILSRPGLQISSLPSQTSRSEACLDEMTPPQLVTVVMPTDASEGQFVVRGDKPRNGVVSVSFQRLESAQSEVLDTRISAAVSAPDSSTDSAAVSRGGSSWWKVAEASGEGILPHGRTTDLQLHKPEASDFLDEEAEVLRLSQSAGFTAEHEADPGFTLLHYVALLGHGTLADALSATRRTHHRFARLAECLIRKHNQAVYVTDKYGCTPLQLAAAIGNTEMVRVLLEPYDLPAASSQVLPSSDSRYSYLNHQDYQIRFSSLHGAVHHGQHEVVIQLLRHGANPQVLDNTRLPAFKVAPSVVSLQKLLRLVLRHADKVPRAVIVQLMAEMLAMEGEFQANKMWTKAGKYASFKPPEEGSERFSALAMELMGGGQSGDVSSTIKRYFKQLCSEDRAELVLEYVLTAVRRNHGRLVEIMIDRICADCPHVLLAPRWHETLEPLVTAFPSLFHRLLYNLQDMRDEDVRGFVRGFVRCLNPSKLAAQPGERTQSVAAGDVGAALLSLRRGEGDAAGGYGAGGAAAVSRAHAVDRVKLLIYQQLVEGLKKVSYRIIKTFFEESDQRLLNDMAQFPIFAEFVGLVANMDTGKAAESDSSRQLLLEFLRPRSSRENMYDMPAASATANIAPTTGSPSPSSRQYPAPPSMKVSGGPGGCASLHNNNNSTTTTTTATATATTTATSTTSGATSLPPATTNAQSKVTSWGETGCVDVVKANPASPVNWLRGYRCSQSRGRDAKGGKDAASQGSHHQQQQQQQPGGLTVRAAAERWSARCLQTLNVRRVLRAAVIAGKADNVEAAVGSLVGWVETNSLDRKAVFLAGITAELVKALATRFPSACAILLNLVSKDVLEQLDTLQVSANVLYGKDHLVKCSHVRNHFTWREQELRKLRSVEGYDDHVVDALVDYGVPFECVYKAAVEMGDEPGEHATPDHFAALIEHGFTGPELKQLISNGIRLAKVIGYIEECAKPPPAGLPQELMDKLLNVAMPVLLRDMLKERLSPRIVDIILREGKMFETTRYNNFRPGCPLREVYPEPLFVPTYTHHFVQLLLISWGRGVKNSHGKLTRQPWAKDFIDTIFEPNDPLCTKLKSAYDNKLTDTHVYIQDTGDGDVGETGVEAPGPSGVGGEASVQLRAQSTRQEREQALRERRLEHEKQVRHVRHLLSIFVSRPLLLHRWPVYLAAHLWLLAQSAVYTYWQRLEDLYSRARARRFGYPVDPVQKVGMGTIDAAVLVIPLLSFFHLGVEDMLTALVDADAPSSWFHFAVVRALYTVHWNMFGAVMVWLSVAAQLMFAACFLVFFLLVLNCETDDDEGRGGVKSPVRPLVHKSCVEVSLSASVLLSASMLLERLLEARVPQLATWASFGRHLELCCHGMVWTVAVIVWSSQGANLVPALSGLTMLLFVARLTLFGLVTDKLSTAVLALLEILNDSRYFFLLIALVYGGFVLAVAGLRQAGERSPRVYSAALFTVLLGDFQSDQLTDQDSVWRYPGFSLVLMSMYAILMMIVFMNLLIATMNDTYDRVKEFCEVEVMRLRSHMMVFVKDFMERGARPQRLEPLDGEALHLLLRPEALKSSRLLTLGSADPASENSSWMGRITYMRTSIVREVSEVVRQRADAQTAAISSRLDQVEAEVMGLTGDRVGALERRMERLERGIELLLVQKEAAAGV